MISLEKFRKYIREGFYYAKFGKFEIYINTINPVFNVKNYVNLVIIFKPSKLFIKKLIKDHNFVLNNKDYFSSMENSFLFNIGNESIYNLRYHSSISFKIELSPPFEDTEANIKKAILNLENLIEYLRKYE